MYKKIINSEVNYPSTMDKKTKDLCQNLLQKDLSKRFGNLKNGINDIKNHPWFDRIDWMGILNKEIKAPFIP
jgi:protein kinase A